MGRAADPDLMLKGPVRGPCGFPLPNGESEEWEGPEGNDPAWGVRLYQPGGKGGYRPAGWRVVDVSGRYEDFLDSVADRQMALVLLEQLCRGGAGRERLLREMRPVDQPGTLRARLARGR